MSTPSLTIRTSARSLAVAVALALAAIAVVVPVAGAGLEHSRSIEGRTASVTLPTGNTVEQWNKIAEDTVVGSGAFQIEAFIYMAYESTAVYDATVALQGGHKPLLPAFRVWKKASPDAAIVEAAYRTLTHYFPAASATLDPLYAAALAAIPDGQAKLAGQRDRPGGRQPGHPRPYRRRPDHTDRLDVDLPDTHARSRGVAAYAPRVPGAADPVGRERAPLRPQERRPVPPRPAAVTVELRLGNRVQRAEDLRQYDEHSPHHR